MEEGSISIFKKEIRQIHGQQVLRWIIKGTGKDEPYNIPNTTLVYAGQYNGNGLQKLDRLSCSPVAAGEDRTLC